MPAPAPNTESIALVQEAQRLIEGLYGIRAPHPAADFLLTDFEYARVLSAGAMFSTEESLLVQEDEEGLALSLFLDEALLARLGPLTPAERLEADHLSDLWTLLEGVSHFIYLTWNATRERSVTPMELELQAEVDKFAASMVLWQRHHGAIPGLLHSMLFDMTAVDEMLPESLQARYRDANRYAGRYCLTIEREYLRKRRVGLIGELRGFYREDRGGKLARIGHS